MISGKQINITFSFQYDRTGNKFLQRGIYKSVKDKLGTLIYDDDAFAIFNYISFGTGALPEKSKLKHKSYLITLAWEDLLANEEMLKRILKHYSEAKIFFILRSQLSILPSYYRYAYTKIGGTKSYKFFINEIISTDVLDYDKCIINYFNVFGKKHIKVFFFEDMKYDSANYIRQILMYSGLDEKDSMPSLRELHKNQSPSDYDVRASIRLNRCFIPIKYLFPLKCTDKFREKITPYVIKALHLLRLNRLNKVDLCDSLEIKEKINQRYKTSNKKLIKLLQLDLHKYEYPL